MALPLEKFIRQLEDSGIVAGETLKDFIPPSASPKDAEELALELVRQKKLTKFQAEEISKGKAKSLTLGNYVLMEKIGAGGMGQVFKAHHRRMKRVVAIKLLPPALTKNAAAIARFEREVEAAAKITHPNIVAAHDADCAKGVHFLVMEFVEGSDLSVLVRKTGPFPVDKAVNCIQQVANGLEAAHKKGIVHRDIKPSNLLLDSEGVVKILDMGLARLSGESDVAPQAELTSTGTVMGTVDYMAPEQAVDSKTADSRADIYALGCTLHYLLTGKPTYEGDSLMNRLLAHRDHPIPSLPSVCPAVPEPLEAVFTKMVAKRVGDRYQTMTEVIAALDRCGSLLSKTTNAQQHVESSTELVQTIRLEGGSVTETNAAQLEKVTKPLASGSKKNLLIGAAVLGVVILLAGLVVSQKPKDDRLTGTKQAPVSDEAKKPLFFQTPGFDPWMKEVASMPAENQVEAVNKKLVELNPGFDGKVFDTENSAPPKIDNGEVTEFSFNTENVTDISPVRALRKLQRFHCGSWNNGGNLSDLSPLKGMKITHLNFGRSRLLSDLSPLQGMPLIYLCCGDTQVVDLSPLKGMPLSELACHLTPVANLSPLNGMRLTKLWCFGSQVSDLSPIDGMPLTFVSITPKDITKGMDVIRRMKSLQTIGIDWEGFPAIEFWKKYDAGEFGTSKPPTKPITDFNSPAFQQWVKEVAAMPAEKQVEAVSKKLMELNPGFDGKMMSSDGFFKDHETPTIENGVVTELHLKTDDVRDLSPIRVFVGLRSLKFNSPTSAGRAKLRDLSPLSTLQSLRNLNVAGTEVSDLISLRGMSLEGLVVTNTPVTDLRPLEGMASLKVLLCGFSAVTDLSPLKELSLTTLVCRSTRVSDLSTLHDCKSLRSLIVTSTKVTATGVAALQAVLPNCKIEWDDPTKPKTP